MSGARRRCVASLVVNQDQTPSTPPGCLSIFGTAPHIVPCLPPAPTQHSAGRGRAAANVATVMVAMTEPRDPPTGCALFGIYNGMFRRRRSASMTSLHRINGAEAEAEAAAPPNQKPAAHRDSSLARRPSAMPVPAAAQNGRSRPAAKAAPAAEPAAEYSGMAAELDRMILDHQRVKGTAQLVRATSGNMMLHRNLGNLNAGGRAANERKAPHGYASSGMGNIVREPRPAPAAGGQLCRALSHRTDPEKLKEMGNEERPRSPRSDASSRPSPTARRPSGSILRTIARTTGLPACTSGEPDKAIYHMKQSSNESAGADVSRAQSVKSRIARSNDARRLKNWITVLQEAQAAVADGADCAPQVMALQAEALLRLQRHDEADSLLSGAGAPRFGVDESTKFFGTFGHAYFLIVRAQVDMAAGRFEDAVATAQTAFQLDPSNREVSVVQRRAKAAAAARLRGNDLFKAAKFAEACAAYGEGLDREPGNAVLLCNRAACHAKLGRHEKAVEDCSAALDVRPSYSKARLRRADCNVKLERWEASLRDYQVLVQELPENEDVKKALSEVEAKLKGQRHGAAAARSQH
eukprot:XP_020393845.1 inactive TPR repeat-containing thioredoxin TTL3 [Zea mays]